MTEASFIIFGISNLRISLLVGISCFVTYNIQRMLGFEKTFGFNSERHLWLFNAKYLIGGLILLAIVPVPFLLANLHLSDLIILGFTGILSIGYSLKIEGFWSRLRDIPGVKIYLIGLVWVLVTILLPFFHTNNGHSLSALILLCIERFLFIIAITIPFDIRDIYVDHKNLKTIPQLFGIKKSIQLSLVLLGISFFVQFLLLITGFSRFQIFIGFGMTYVILFFILNKSDNQKELYYTGLIDGLIILPYLMILLTRILS